MLYIAAPSSSCGYFLQDYSNQRFKGFLFLLIDAMSSFPAFILLFLILFHIPFLFLLFNLFISNHFLFSTIFFLTFIKQELLFKLLIFLF